MDPQIDDDRARRIRQARQVLAGSQLSPPEDPLGFGDRLGFGASGELRYFVGLAVLVVVAAIVWAIWGMGAASPILLILALALLAGWFIL